MITPNIIFNRKKKCPWRELDGSVVIVDIETEACLSMNEVASKIWLSLDGTHTVADVVDIITDTFDVSREQASEDAARFLNQLLEQRYIFCEDTSHLHS
jgi:hypothetical protein